MRNIMPICANLAIHCCVMSRPQVIVSLEIATRRDDHAVKSWEGRTMAERRTDCGEIRTTRRRWAWCARRGAAGGPAASGSDGPRILALALRGSVGRMNSGDCRADARLLRLPSALLLGRCGVRKCDLERVALTTIGDRPASVLWRGSCIGMKI